jgi:hypothetical protein
MNVGEARNLIISYQYLSNVKERKQFKRGTLPVEEYEFHMRFVIQHYFYVDERALFSLMPLFLTGYVCLELERVGRFGGWMTFYRYLLEMTYGVGTTVSWSKPQEETIGFAMTYVFEKILEEQDVFDDTLFGFLLIFLHETNDITSCIDRVFSQTSPNIVEQLNDFFEHDILVRGVNGRFTAQDLLMSVLDASGVMLGQCREERELREKILAEKKDILWQHLSEERLLTYILDDAP